MSLREYDAFLHRANRDGTTDSVCKYCFVTVCRSTWETDLAQAEHAHVCDPQVVARWKKMRDGNSAESD